MDTTAVTEYEALDRLSKANRRANSILMALIAIILLGALFGGYSVYKSQQSSFDKLNASRLKASNRNLAEIRTMTVESIRYRTCIEVVRIEDRTPAVQRECFRKADLPGGLTEKDFVTYPPEIAGSALDIANTNQQSSKPSSTPSSGAQASPQKSSNTSSPKSAPKKKPPQSNNQQPETPNCVVDLLGLHLGC